MVRFVTNKIERMTADDLVRLIAKYHKMPADRDALIARFGSLREAAAVTPMTLGQCGAARQHFGKED